MMSLLIRFGLSDEMGASGAPESISMLYPLGRLDDGPQSLRGRGEADVPHQHLGKTQQARRPMCSRGLLVRPVKARRQRARTWVKRALLKQ